MFERNTMNVASSSRHLCDDTIHSLCLDVYDGPIQDTLYKVKRPFVNKIIFLFDPRQSPTGHVIEGRAYEDRPPNIKIEYNLFQWQKLYDKNVQS